MGVFECVHRDNVTKACVCWGRWAEGALYTAVKFTKGK